MPSVFPVMPSLGYSTGVEYKEALQVYDDLSYRRYLRSVTAHETRQLEFRGISQTDFDAIKSFFKARKAALTSDHPFYVYDADVVSAIDPTGVSATGRHTAIFLDAAMNFTREGRCRYSGSLAVLFLN